MSAAEGAAEGEGGAGRRLTFSDKDEHMYFWFPLLAGLSELTFDPRQDIRYSALEARPPARAIRFRSFQSMSCATCCFCSGVQVLTQQAQSGG